MMKAQNNSSQDTEKNTSSLKSNVVLNKRALLVITAGLVVFAGMVVIMIIRVRTTSPISESTNVNRTGVIVQQSYDGALPLKPIDQNKYQKIIQKSWDEALVRGSANIVNFPNDPNLVAFSYKPTGSSAAQSFVLYRNKPITIKTKKVLELSGGVSSRITLSSQSYALVVVFEYTPDVQKLQP
jgi:hypothetical protein